MSNCFIATIPGIPRPQGSLKIMTSATTGRAFARNSDTTVAHRNLVVGVLAEAWQDDPLDVPVQLETWFYLPRPKSHYGTGRNADVLKPSAPAVPTTKPALDKMLRLVGDAMSVAGVVRDDSVIATAHAYKRYSHLPRTVVTVSW